MPTSGGYVLGVSGGVDSISLLHYLANNNPGDWRLTVAHLDHGIRPDSEQDRLLVQETARSLGLPFVYQRVDLGPGASEDEARTARYDFLRKAQQASGSRAIVTAHHQDDLLETAILNILRGTGRKGLTSLNSRHDTVRPLLHLPKQAIIAYAHDQGLRWNDDPTNFNTKYLRNYIRHKILPRLSYGDRQQLVNLINQAADSNHEIDEIITNQLHLQSSSGKLDRVWFSSLPYAVSREVMAGWLRANGVAGFDKRTLNRLVVAAKTGHTGKQYDVYLGVRMVILKNHLALEHLER